MPGASLSCREVLEFLAAWLEGELAEDVKADFQRHLALCPGCVHYLESYRETIRLGRLAHDSGGPSPEEVPEELVEAILSSRRLA